MAPLGGTRGPPFSYFTTAFRGYSTLCLSLSPSSCWSLSFCSPPCDFYFSIFFQKTKKPFAQTWKNKKSIKNKIARSAISRFFLRRTGGATPPRRSCCAAALELLGGLIPAERSGRALVREFLSPSLRPYIGFYVSAAATKCASPRRCPLAFQTCRENTLPGLTQNLTGGTVALLLRGGLIPAGYPRGTPVRKVLSPSLRAHIGAFVSSAATKRCKPAAMAFFLA